MPQITFPFYYLADYSASVVVLSLSVILMGVYVLPSVKVVLVARRALVAMPLPALVMSSPLEQFLGYPLASLQVADHVLSLTVVGLYSLLAVLVLVVLFAMVQVTLVPGRWSVSVEAFYESLLGLTRAQVGASEAWAFPLLAGSFGGLLVLNLLSNVPYGFTVTSGLSVCLGLSFAVWCYTLLLGLANQGLSFFDHFVPSGTPALLAPLLAGIETVSYAARALSLGVRLFSNMLAGHTLLAILAGFLYSLAASSLVVAFVCLIPFGLFVALVGLELAVSFIQSYVFVVLVASYLRDSL